MSDMKFIETEGVTEKRAKSPIDFKWPNAEAVATEMFDVYPEASNAPDLPDYPWPDPKKSDLEADDFLLIWGCIRTWDINVPEAYHGYCGATGNHVMSILFATGKRNIQDYL